MLRRIKLFVKILSAESSTWPFKYHGYHGVLTGRLRWLSDILVAVTGTTESVSPLYHEIGIPLFFKMSVVHKLE